MPYFDVGALSTVDEVSTQRFSSTYSQEMSHITTNKIEIEAGKRFDVQSLNMSGISIEGKDPSHVNIVMESDVQSRKDPLDLHLLEDHLLPLGQ